MCPSVYLIVWSERNRCVQGRRVCLWAKQEFEPVVVRVLSERREGCGRPRAVRSAPEKNARAVDKIHRKKR